MEMQSGVSIQQNAHNARILAQSADLSDPLNELHAWGLHSSGVCEWDG